MHLRPVTASTRIRLTDAAAHPPRGAPVGEDLERKIQKHVTRLEELQERLYADGRYAMLIVLQGRDAAGKDGVVRHVFEGVNPQGCEVTSFKAPTELEQQHDFLWRIHQRVPARGMIGIFNRSHYEDVIVPRVHQSLPRRVWASRYDQINDFERMLAANNVVVLKFFLHISRDEQKKRLRARLTDRSRNWKFRAGDLDDRARWPAYTAAYRELLHRCSTRQAPWYVVPADDKHVRTWMIARTIADRLDALGLRFPPVDPKVRRMKIV